MLEPDCFVSSISTDSPLTVASTVISPFVSVVTSAVPEMLSGLLLSSLGLDVSAFPLSSTDSCGLVSAACSPSLPSTSSAYTSVAPTTGVIAIIAARPIEIAFNTALLLSKFLFAIIVPSKNAI